MGLSVVFSVISLALSVGAAIYAATLDFTTEPDDTGLHVTKEGTASTKNIAYGHTRVGSTKLYSNVHDNNSSLLLQCYAFGFGVSSIHNIYIDDVEVISSSKPRKETSTGGIDQLLFSSNDLINGFNQQVTLQLRAGLETGIPMSLAIDNSDGEWTTAFRGDDVACMSLLTKRIVEDGTRIVSDRIQVTALVDGVPVYDPRYHSNPSQKSFSYTGSSGLIECGRSPALCLLDYLTSTKYGVGLSYDYINLTSFASAANWCEANDFYIDGEIDSGNSFADNIQQILDCAGLILTVENGEIYCHYEDIVLDDTQEFNHDNIIKGTFNIQETSSSTYFNLIEVEYKNTDLDDKQDTYTVPSPADTDPQIIQDGEIHSSTLSLPLVRLDGSNSLKDTIVDILANRELRKAQYQRQVVFDVDLAEYPIRIFDTFALTDENLGWEGKRFRVMQISKSINDPQGISIATIRGTEYDDEIYTGTKNGGGGGKPIPKPTPVTPVAGLRFDQTDYITEGKGWLRWSNTFFESDVSFQVDYKRSSDSGWTQVGKTTAEQWEFPFLPADTYDFSVITLSNVYGSSPRATLTGVVISGVGILPPVTGVTADFTGFDCEFTWDDMLDEPVARPPDQEPRKVRDVFSHYRIALFRQDNSLIGVFTPTTNEYTFTFAQNTELLRTIHAEVQIVATDGSMSQVATYSEYTAINPQHIALTGLEAKSSLGAIFLRWNPDVEPDYAGTKVRYKKGALGVYEYEDILGNEFTYVPPVDDPAGTIYYFNVAAFDVFDQDNLNWSNEASALKQSIDDLLPEFPDELSDIRNPDKAQTDTGELIMNVASPDRETVTGFGLYATNRATGDDVESGKSRMLVAADEFGIAAGGHANWDGSRTYTTGDRVNWVVNDTKHSTYEALRTTTGESPPTSSLAWKVIVENNFQTALYIDIDGVLKARGAIVDTLDARQITTGTLDADRIGANSITGNKINATTRLEVGAIPNQKAILDGSDPTYRLGIGSDNLNTSPFRVTQSGVMYAEGADVSGIIRAEQLIIDPDDIPPDMDNRNNPQTYYQSSPPTGDIPEGSIWFDTDDGNRQYRYNGSSWVLVEDQNKVETYRQNEPPTGNISVGSIWYDTNDNNKQYRYSGSSWVSVEDENKVKTYYQAGAPSGSLVVGSMWYETDNFNKPYRWSGSGWISVEDGNKAKTYYQSNAPTGTIPVGSIWFETDNNNKQYRWSGSSWQSVEDTNKVTTYRQSSPPSTPPLITGSIWYDTDDGNRQYRYSGSGWVSVADENANKVYYQASAPSGSNHKTNDSWYETDQGNRLYRWNGSGWIAASSTGLNDLYPDQSSTAIQSDNFVAGQRGWAIYNNGNCEFVDGVFRGDLQAASGTFEGTVLAKNIIGDIVGARVYPQPTRSFSASNNSYGYLNYVDFWLNGSPSSQVVDRTLVSSTINLEVELRLQNTGSSGSRAEAQALFSVVLVNSDGEQARVSLTRTISSTTGQGSYFTKDVEVVLPSISWESPATVFNRNYFLRVECTNSWVTGSGSLLTTVVIPAATPIIQVFSDTGQLS